MHIERCRIAGFLEARRREASNPLGFRVGFGEEGASSAPVEGGSGPGWDTRRRPLMLGRLVLEPQHVGVRQEVGPKFCGDAFPTTGPQESSPDPQVLHRVIHRCCGFVPGRVPRAGSSDPAEDRFEQCPTGSYAYRARRTGRAATAARTPTPHSAGHRQVTASSRHRTQDREEISSRPSHAAVPRCVEVAATRTQPGDFARLCAPGCAGQHASKRRSP